MSRIPKPQRETPAAVTVLDRDLIRATGYRDIGRLLRLMPGMQVAQESGNDQWVSYLGPGTDYPRQPAGESCRASGGAERQHPVLKILYGA